MRKEPAILLIETSAALCSVGLTRGNHLIGHKLSGRPNNHSKELAIQIRELLDEGAMEATDLDAIAVSAGPGSYTGLRVGISTAKAMCFALGIPMIAVDTLYALAWRAYELLGLQAIYFPNIDARRMEVYIAAYDSDLQRIMANTAVEVRPDTFDKLLSAGEHIVFCGSGTSKCADMLKKSGIELVDIQCSAGLLAAPAYLQYSKGEHADLEQFKPEYVKAPNITAPKTSIV